MFPYPGGKSKISKWICPSLAKTKVYIEPFGGAFWVYLKWDYNASIVVYNELNIHLSNIVECIRTDASRLTKELQQYKSEDEATFLGIRSTLFNPDSSLLRPVMPDFYLAARYIYLQVHSFVGHRVTNTMRYQKIDTTKWQSRYKAFIKKMGMDLYVNKFKAVTHIRSSDFEKVIQEFDNVDALFYVDPPYWQTEHYYTEAGFNDEDHLRLCRVLKGIRGKFALSYYEFEELSKWYPKTEFTWKYKKTLSPMSAGAELARAQKGHGNKVDTSKHQSVEVLILNY